MKSHRSNRSLGFSLLEMVIVLFIIMVLAGLAIGLSRDVFGQEELRGTAREISLLAKTARLKAIEENVSYKISITPNLLSLQPLQELDSDQPEESAEKVIEYKIPEKVILKMKQWGDQDWQKIEEITWIFKPSGLCAPNSFRLERDDAWMEMSFNPLTANKQDEAWVLP